MERIELAKPADFDVVAGLARQVHDLHVQWRPDIFLATETPLPRGTYFELLEREGIYVLRRNYMVLAYAVVSIQEMDLPVLVPRRVWKLEELCVDANFRRQGLGSQFLNGLMELARQAGCTDLQLTCDPHNQAGRALYESLGMQIKAIQYQRKL